MNSNNKISIIIPVYNEYEEYLIQCIESIINQTYNNIEIIIIDDGSERKVKALCDKIKEKDRRIRVIHKENEGVSKARNIGILQATGNYIMFVDSDDWLELNTCEKIMENIEKHTDVLIFNSIINYPSKRVKNNFINNFEQTLSKEQIEDLELQIIHKNIAKYKPEEKVVGVTWGKLYKKDFIIKNNLFFKEDLRRAEDHIFFLEVLEKNGVYRYYNQHLYNYRKSSKSTVNKFSHNIAFTFSNTLKYLYDFVSKKPEIFMQAYYARVVTYILASIKNDYFHCDNKEKQKDKFIRLEKMLNTEPYNLGIKKVNKKILTPKQKIKLYLLKHKRLLYYIFIINNYKNKKESFN